MSIYRYPAGSPVAEIKFRYATQRAPVALLTAQPQAGAGQLATIRSAMEAQGWQAVPVSSEGREMLQVTGFKESGELGALLAAYHFADSAPQIIAEAEDHPTKTIHEWAEHHSLKTAGWLNLIGDAAMLVSGIHAKDPYKIIAGGLYTGGAGVLSRYANVKTERQVQEVLSRTAEQLKQQAVQLPEDSSLFSIARDQRQGKIKNMEDFLYRYPAETMLSAYTMGAMSMLLGGIHYRDHMRIGYGISSLGFKTASLLIPEKHKGDDGASALPAGPVGDVMRWVQEKPLRLMGFGSMVSDILLGMSAFSAFQKGRKNGFAEKGKGAFILDFVTTGTYLTADMLLAVSNKHTENADGKFSSDEQTRVEAMAAETIARQPVEIRGPLVLKLSRFLAKQPEMRGGVQGISQGINTQVAQLGHNPWAQRVAAQPVGSQAIGL